MLIFDITIIEIAIFTAIFSYVLIDVTFKDGMIFENLNYALDRYLPKIIYKGFFNCSVCLAGQLGFWTYFVLSIIDQNYHYLNHLILILLSILFTKLLQKYL